MGSVIGNLVGGLFGGNRAKQEGRNNQVGLGGTDRKAEAASSKATAAGKLALIKTSSRGVLGNDSSTGRKKLLGN